MNKVGRGKPIIEAQMMWDQLASFGGWLMLLGGIIVLVVTLVEGTK